MIRRLAATFALVVALGGGVGGCALSCPTALAEGTLVRTGPTTLGVRGAFDGAPIAVRWPLGHGVRSEGDRLVLADALGSVVAREGDTVSMGGGESEGVFGVCGPIAVRPGP